MYKLLQCSNEKCRLRFPAPHRVPVTVCPRCGSDLVEISQSFLSPRVEPDAIMPVGPQLDIMLDNLRSAFNVGSILRTADGAAIRRAYLCGITPTPENPKVAKTALSAEFSTPWEYNLNGLDTVIRLKSEGHAIWSLEGGPSAEPLTSALIGLPDKMVLVAGNELAGIDPGILDASDRIVFLPMHGFKRSLNVAVAFGIAIYLIRFMDRRKTPQTVP